jgi:predicted AAA+ superfamily ATPase
MIEKKAKDKFLEMANKYPVLVFTGPRQSGKTTISKMIFQTNETIVSWSEMDQFII